MTEMMRPRRRRKRRSFVQLPYALALTEANPYDRNTWSDEKVSGEHLRALQVWVAFDWFYHHPPAGTDKGYHDASNAELAAKAGCSPSVAKRSKAWLVANGWIKVIEQWDGPVQMPSLVIYTDEPWQFDDDSPDDPRPKNDPGPGEGNPDDGPADPQVKNDPGAPFINDPPPGQKRPGNSHTTHTTNPPQPPGGSETEPEPDGGGEGMTEAERAAAEQTDRTRRTARRRADLVEALNALGLTQEARQLGKSRQLTKFLENGGHPGCTGQQMAWALRESLRVDPVGQVSSWPGFLYHRLTNLADIGEVPSHVSFEPAPRRLAAVPEPEPDPGADEQAEWRRAWCAAGTHTWCRQRAADPADRCTHAPRVPSAGAVPEPPAEEETA